MISLQLDLSPGASIRSLLGELRRRDLQVEGLESHVLDDGSERIRLDVRAPASIDLDSILTGLSQLGEVSRIDLAVVHSPDLEADEEESARGEGRLRFDRLTVSSSS
jgi:hypothetical protein